MKPKLELIVRVYDGDKMVEESQPCTVASGLSVRDELQRKHPGKRVEIEEGPDWPKKGLT